MKNDNVKIYLITVSDDRGKFKTFTKKSKKDEFDLVYDIELSGYYVESIEEIEQNQSTDLKKEV